MPEVTPKDKVVNAISKLKQELAAIPSPSSLNQLSAIEKLQSMFSNYKKNEPSTTANQHHEENSRPTISECQSKLLDAKKQPSKQPSTLTKQPATPKKKVATHKEIHTSFPRVPSKEISSQQSTSNVPVSSQTRSNAPPTSYVKSTHLPIATRTRSKKMQANESKLFSTSMLVDKINEAFKLQKKQIK